MGAPALDQKAGCLLAAVFPGFFQLEFLSLLREHLLSPHGPAALSFLRELARLPLCNDLVGAPKGRLPLSPVDGRLQDCAFVRLLLSTAAAAGAGRQRAAPVVIARICFGTADILEQTLQVCGGRLFWPKARRSLRWPRSMLLLPRFFL